MVWAFDVSVSNHAWLARGVTVAQYRRVEVLSDSYEDARLLACQLASAVDGSMPTDAHYVE